MKDLIVFTLLERVTHAIQRAVGLTNYGLCRYVGAFIGGLCVIRLIDPHLAGALTWPYGVVCLFMFLDGVWLLRLQEQEGFERAKRGLANPNKVAPFEVLLRLIWWVLVITDGIGLAFHMSPSALITLTYSTSFLLYAYLRSCDPLPPTQSKLRRLLDRLGSVPTRANGNLNSRSLRVL